VSSLFVDGVTPLNAANLNKLIPFPGGSVVNGQWLKGSGGAVVWAAIAPADLGSGSPSSSTFLRGDGTWAAPAPGVPAGVIEAFAGSVAPSGYLFCDGSAVSRTTYAALFAAIGSGYGAGDGSTTFNLPDLQGRIPVGLGTNAAVNALNKNDGQAAANRRPQHRTTDAKTVSAGTLAVTDSGHTHGIPSNYISTAGGSNIRVDQADAGPNFATNSGTASAAAALSVSGAPALGGSIGTNNANDALDTPSFVVVQFIIKT